MEKKYQLVNNLWLVIKMGNQCLRQLNNYYKPKIKMEKQYQSIILVQKWIHKFKI